MGNKTANLFERKKKDAEQLATDKVAEAQKLAEEQAKLATNSLVQTKNEAGQLAASTGNIFYRIFMIYFQSNIFYINLAEETKNLVEADLAKAGQAVNSSLQTASDTIEHTKQTVGNTVNQVSSTIDQTKQQAGAAVGVASSAVEQTKKAANEAINQGVKAAEQVVDAQVQQAEKVNIFKQ